MCPVNQFRNMRLLCLEEMLVQDQLAVSHFNLSIIASFGGSFYLIKILVKSLPLFPSQGRVSSLFPTLGLLQHHVHHLISSHHHHHRQTVLIIIVITASPLAMITSIGQIQGQVLSVDYLIQSSQRQFKKPFIRKWQGLDSHLCLSGIMVYDFYPQCYSVTFRVLSKTRPPSLEQSIAQLHRKGRKQSKTPEPPSREA